MDNNQHFSLPEEFLTFDDIQMDNNFKKQTKTTEFCFPSEFPFVFEDGQLSQLTQKSTLNHSPHNIEFKNYEKRHLVMSGSPQSSLARFGTSELSSPQTSSMGSVRDSWDLIYQAAAEIAKLKLARVDLSLSNGRKIIRDHHSLQPRRNSSAFYDAFVQQVREEQLLKLQQQKYVWSNNHAHNSELQNRVSKSAFGSYEEKQLAAWRSLQYVKQQNERNRTIFRDSVVNGGSGSHFSGGAKKQSSGTGVFLPRSYGTQTSHNINKPGCLTTPILDKGVPRLGNHINVMNAGVGQLPGHTRFPDGFYSDYDMQLANMKLLLMQKRQHIKPGGYGSEISVPQEWTF